MKIRSENKGMTYQILPRDDTKQFFHYSKEPGDFLHTKGMEITSRNRWLLFLGFTLSTQVSMSLCHHSLLPSRTKWQSRPCATIRLQGSSFQMIFNVPTCLFLPSDTFPEATSTSFFPSDFHFTPSLKASTWTPISLPCQTGFRGRDEPWNPLST